MFLCKKKKKKSGWHPEQAKRKNILLNECIVFSEHKGTYLNFKIFKIQYRRIYSFFVVHFAEGKKKSVAELEETLAARQKTRYKLPDSGKLITTVFLRTFFPSCA